MNEDAHLEMEYEDRFVNDPDWDEYDEYDDDDMAGEWSDTEYPDD